MAVNANSAQLLVLCFIARGDGPIDRDILAELLGLACAPANVIAHERPIVKCAPSLSKNEHNRTPRDGVKSKAHRDERKFTKNTIASMKIKDFSQCKYTETTNRSGPNRFVTT